MAICAIAGGGQALVPAPAAAMTSEELTAICSSVFGEIGDPTICVTDTQSGSGGPAGYGATEPSKGVIVIVDQKPEGVDCGFGIYALRRADCPGKPGRGQPGDGPLQFGTGRPPVNVVEKLPPGRRRGPLMKCVHARTTFADAMDARQFLADLRKKLGGEEDFRDPQLLDSLIGRARSWIDWSRDEGQITGLTKPLPNDLKVRSTARQIMAEFDETLDAALKGVNKTLRSADCRKLLDKAGAP